MALSVFCGSFQPELETAFLERLRALRPGPGRPVAVVAPSRRLADRLQRLVALDGKLAVLGVRFHTFYSLALEIAEETGVLENRAVVGDGLFHDKIVDGLLAAPPRGRRLSRGLAGAHRSSLRDLVDAGIEPGQFREHLAGLIADEEDRRRLESLLTLQQGYLARLNEIGVLAPSGLARAAAAAVEEGRAKGLEPVVEFLYYGFYDLTGSQSDFFLAVAGAFPCSVFFPYRKGHPAFAFAERFLEVKLGRGGRAPEQLDAPPSQALGPALDCLFSPGKRSTVRAGTLRLFNVSGARDEAWIVAKEILALRSGPHPIDFADIGVVARTLEPYRAALVEAFEESAIPYSLGASEPLLRHPIAKLALSLLTLRRRDFPATAVLDLVQSPYFELGRFRGTRGGRGLADDWTRLLERLGVHSGWLQWQGKVAPCAERDLELYPQLVAEGREGRVIGKAEAAALWSWVDGLHSALAGPAAKGKKAPGWEAMAAHARKLLEENLRVEAGEPGAEAWDAVLEAVDGLGVFGLAAPEAGWETFLEVLEERLRRASLDGPPECRGVRVLDAMDARGDSFRQLFLIGLQEGLFPRQVREDALLPDSVRSALQHPGGYWVLPKLEGYAEERLLFQLLAASAGERLTCVYQRSDDEGRAKVPSIYLRELCRACGVDFDDARLNVRVPRPPLEKLRTIEPERLSPKEFALLAGADAEALRGFDGLGVDRALLSSCLERVEELNRPGEPGAMDGLIGPPGEYLAALASRGWSPTALEAYVRCPFQFFAERVLGLREPEEPSERGALSPLIRGQLYHAVLQRFYESLLQTGFWKEKEGVWQARLERAIEDVLGRTGWKELGVYPLLWEATRRAMTRRLREFAEGDIVRARSTGLIPSLFETELQAESEGLRLRGKVDRLDAAADGRFLVVDYKSTGSTVKLPEQVRRLRKLQPPLYLELAQASRPEGRAAGAALYCLEGTSKEPGGPVIQEYPAAQWQASRRALLERLQGHARRVAEGLFFIAKDEDRDGACAYCAFGSLCRKAHPASWRRVESSRLMADFVAQRELPK